MFNLDQFITESRKAVPDILNLIGFKVTGYEPKELQRLEHTIQLLFPQGFTKSTTIYPFGFFVGEVLRQNIPGAEWVNPKEETNVFDLAIQYTMPGGYSAMAYPFVRVNKFSKDYTDDLYNWFLTIQEMAVNPMTEEIIDGMPNGKWVDIGDGRKLRVITVNKNDVTE